jgi:hypothetical protein
MSMINTRTVSRFSAEMVALHRMNARECIHAVPHAAAIATAVPCQPVAILLRTARLALPQSEPATTATL